MYRVHLSKWGSDKKNKEKEMRAVARKLRRRGFQGKKTIVRVRGRPLKSKTFARYWQRKGENIDDIATRMRTSATPEAVEFLTPIPQPLTPPPMLSEPERIFSCIRDYYDGSFRSGNWVNSTKPEARCRNARTQESGMLHLSLLRDQTFVACQRFANGEIRESQQALISALTNVKNILWAEDPMTLLCLLVLVLHARRQGLGRIASFVLRTFSVVGESVLGNTHPFRQICSWLASAHSSQFDEVVARALESLGNHFEKELGFRSASTLYARMEYIVQVIGPQDCEQEGTALRSLLQECENHLGMHDFRTVQIRLALAFHYVRKGDDAEALRIGLHILDMIQIMQRVWDMWYLDTDCLYVSAHCWQAIQQADLCETGGRETSEFLFELEGWLIEWYTPDVATCPTQTLERRTRFRDLFKKVYWSSSNSLLYDEHALYSTYPQSTRNIWI